jgi:hypothetical protein
MNPKIRGIVRLGEEVLSRLDLVDRPARSLSPNVQTSTLRRLDEAQDWGQARNAIRGVRDKIDGADEAQVQAMLNALKANLDRLKKQNPPDGTVWKNSRAAAEEAADAAIAKAATFRGPKADETSADELADRLVMALKENLTEAKSFEDADALSNLMAQLENTQVFNKLVKEGLTEAISQRTTSNLIDLIRKQNKVAELDNFLTTMSPATRAALNKDPAVALSVREAAASVRINLLKKAYKDVTKLSKTNPDAAATKLSQIDNYVIAKQGRTAADGRPMPMFTDSQRNALAIERTKAFGAISTNPLYGQPRPAAAPQSTRRTMGRADADPLAQPLSQADPDLRASMSKEEMWQRIQDPNYEGPY